MILTESHSARHELAALMRRFYAGRITNWQFEDAFDELPDDEVTREVFQWGPFCSYSDTPEYRFTDRTTLIAERRRIVARWILFLKSGQPYRWPVTRPLPSWLSMPFLLSGLPLAIWLHRWELAFFGLFPLITIAVIHERLERKRIFRAYDEALWPFTNPADYERALLQPPFLTGDVATTAPSRGT